MGAVLAKVMVVVKVMVANKAAAVIQIKPVAVRKEITKTKRSKGERENMYVEFK